MELYPEYLEDHFNIHKLSPETMTSASTQLAAPVRLGICDRPPMRMWDAPSAAIMEVADAKFDVDGAGRLLVEDAPQEAPKAPSSESFDQEASKPADKIQRRLAQNREAARKSRLRKKAYIQVLESSRMKLARLELELGRVRQQGVHVSGSVGDPALGLTGSVNPGVAAFEIDYTHWVEQQKMQTSELRAALQACVSDTQLRILVEAGLSHYDTLFQMKVIAAKSDVFYIISGEWRTAAERFFFWIGGFRPSELLKIIAPQLEPLSDQQATEVYGLQLHAQQAEDALSQGMDKLKQKLSECLTATPSWDSSDVNTYMGQMANAFGKLEELAVFATQADHLRLVMLQELHKILTPRQAARGLLALGDYFQRLRALSSLWAARPCKPASLSSM